MRREIHADDELALCICLHRYSHNFLRYTRTRRHCRARRLDLTQHQEVSGKKLEYIDEETKEKYLPHVIEPSAGVDRMRSRF